MAEWKPLAMQAATATAIGTSAGYGAGKLASKAVTPYVQWSVKTTLPISLYENLIPPKTLFGFVFPTRTFNSAIPAALNMTSAPFTGEFTTQYIDQLNRPPYKSTTGP